MRGPRLLRGVVTAGLSTLLIAVGHVLGGGTVPDLTVLVVLFPLLTGAVVGVADRCRSLRGTIATLAGGQVALHVLLAVLHPHPPVDAAPSGLTMLALHAVATLVVTVLLRHADARAGRRRGPRCAGSCPGARSSRPPTARCGRCAWPRSPLAPAAARARRGADPARSSGGVLTRTPSTAPHPRRGVSSTPPERPVSRTSRPRRRALRLATVLSVAATATVLGAAPAFAHVTAQPGNAAQGSYSVVSLRVPNESDTAGTVKLEVTLPGRPPAQQRAHHARPGLDRHHDEGRDQPARPGRRGHRQRGRPHRDVDREPRHPHRPRRVPRVPAVGGPAAHRRRRDRAARGADLRRRRGRRLGPADEPRRLRARAPRADAHPDPGRG